jgi:hypothetical protein
MDNMQDTASNTATVKQAIEHLQKHFASDAKLCYVHCIEGCEYELRPMLKEELGKRFFYSAAKLKQDD